MNIPAITAVIVVATLIIGATIGLFSILEKHDAVTQQAYQAYELCVMEQTGMTPSGYYAEHGTHLTCE